MQTVTSSSAAARRRPHAAGGREPHETHRRASRTPPWRTFTEWWHFAAEYLVMLPIGAAIALVWVNTDPERYFTVTGALVFWVRDLGMVLFFGLITKEVVEATAAGGVLHPWRRAAAPTVASLGLVLTPLALFAAVVPWLDEPRVLQGWPAVFATDVAFGYFAIRVIFGAHPAVAFFLLLALSANALGILAFAVLGSSPAVNPALALGFMTAALAVAGLLRMARVTRASPYVIGAGTLSWCALYFGGLGPAFALVPILPFVPHPRRDRGFFAETPSGAHDPLSRFERWARHPTQVVLLLFGIVAAGVPLRVLDWGTLGLPLATLIGKPIGLLIGAGIARACGLSLPARIGWRELVVLGLVAASGFTVALFFAAAAVGPGPTLSALKMGALVSAGAVLAAAAAAVLLRVGRFSDGLTSHTS